ncbi:MAG: RloB domain-containing protein [Spiribacter salinus]|uniref:RloB domain-containing protein n=1 Tax=Spiribacter salinus TaxID=1335746 RepID=A0A540VQQ2_9GAMM|nr:MAG: RloB domain-containing protein [Spiribacter salinus]
MGKGKPRQPGKLRRRAPKREPYDHVLILCVGESERVYFQEVRSACSLRAVNVVISPNAEGQDPSRMVRTAKKSQQRQRAQGNEYNQVWLVFDRDRFEQFETALNNCRQGGIEAAWSVPCFEYWLLIHFIQSDAPFRASGGLTGAQCCERELLKHIPDYQKGSPVAFQATWEHVDRAIQTARRRLSDPDWDNEKNPSTNVHELIEYLQTLNQEAK